MHDFGTKYTVLVVFFSLSLQMIPYNLDEIWFDERLANKEKLLLI
jgi:hypothetical protein